MDSRTHIDRFDDIYQLAMDGCQAIHKILDQSMQIRTNRLVEAMGLQNIAQ